MKVALLHDVAGVGKKREVKDVNEGYALNFLLPKGLAESATKSVLSRIETEKKREAEENKIKEDLLAKNLHTIHGQTVEIERAASEKGHLFDGLGAEEIAAIVKEKTRVDMLPSSIHLSKHIKEVGEHTIDIKVQGKQASFTLVVKAK